MPEGSSAAADRSTGDPAPIVGVLTVTAPPAQIGRSVVIDTRGIVVGRDPGCDLPLVGEHIGGHQAIVSRHDQTFLIVDFEGTRPTLVNGDPVHGGRSLRDGDRLTFADAEVLFRLASMHSTSPNGLHDRHRTPDAGTPQWRRRGLRQELHEAPGFSFPTLLLAVLGSVVTAALTGAAGARPWGTLLGAAVGPVVTTTFTTRRTGERGRVRTAAIILVSAGALLITWAGVGLAEQATGESVLPGVANRPHTFPLPDADRPDATTAAASPSGTTAPTTAPVTAPAAGGPSPVPRPSELDCATATVGTASPCPDLTITNAGDEPLRITGMEITGDNAADFTAGQECVGASLATGESCAVSVDFRPGEVGLRRATLVVHQNLPAPDIGTRVALSGVGQQ